MSDRTARSAATRRRFVDVALRLFREKGYAQTSMTQIAQAAGGSRANLYLYFNSKPQLVLSRMRELEPEVVELYAALDALPDHGPEAMRGWIDRARGMWRRYGAEFEALTQATSAEPDVLEDWLGLLRRLCREQVVLYRDCASEGERLDREAHLLVLMMSLEHTFHLLYVRGRVEQEERILAALAVQWARLYGR
ncbi:TetR/AcrR family transcriptional regulator [Saccharopolyspora cebuensis]|uniref:TetR/AcrR family transcriptional regulator n=1 Tax=Saccharopolyspora cebuensis TaxID=418759 RepID=A0ABV4CK32_9PSEU